MLILSFINFTMQNICLQKFSVLIKYSNRTINNIKNDCYEQGFLFIHEIPAQWIFLGVIDMFDVAISAGLL